MATLQTSFIGGIKQAIWVYRRPLAIDIDWVKRGGWIGDRLTGNSYTPPLAPKAVAIEEIRKATDGIGELPTWSKYSEIYPGQKSTRTAGDVSLGLPPASLYAWLVAQRRPDTVVEFGSAFGISGCYWIAALEKNQHGHLYTFEVNEGWAKIAARNLSRINDRYTLTVGTFEDNCDRILNGKPIDIAFIDGIHQADWVIPEFDIVAQRSTPGAIILLDDLDMHDMHKAWEHISNLPNVAGAAKIWRGKIGLIELKK